MDIPWGVTNFCTFEETTQLGQKGFESAQVLALLRSSKISNSEAESKIDEALQREPDWAVALLLSDPTVHKLSKWEEWVGVAVAKSPAHVARLISAKDALTRAHLKT